MKKFSKLVALALAGVMAFALCACGADTNDGSANNNGNTAVVDDNGNTNVVTNTAVKAGLICLHDENSTYDLNFINGFKAACDAAGVEYLIKTGIPEGQEAYDAACELAEAGCNFIFADSFGHEDYIIKAAKEYPEIEFAHATGTQAHTEGLANFHNAFANIFQGRYLAGIVAGMKLNDMIDNGDITAEEAKMGYVGAFTYAEVISGYTSFYLGAKSVCPSVTMEVTFTGSWYDETAEKTGAQTLIDNGCVLISQHADSMGAPTACEQAGVPNVSYNGSTAAACPETFLVSSRIDWTPYFTYCFNAITNGEAIAVDWNGTLETGSVVLTDLGASVAAGSAEAIAEAQAKITSGELHVFDITTFTVNGETLTTYMADVDTDPEYAGDHEAIVDGYFNESGDGLRSAPFFNLQIDGISLLDAAY